MPSRPLTAVFLAVGYGFIGAVWLIHKAEGALAGQGGALGASAASGA